MNDQEILLEADSEETATLIDELMEKPTDGKKKKKKDRKEKKSRKERKQEARTEIEELLQMVEKMQSSCKGEIRKLERRTKEMIELVSALFLKTVRFLIVIN